MTGSKRRYLSKCLSGCNKYREEFETMDLRGVNFPDHPDVKPTDGRLRNKWCAQHPEKQKTPFCRQFGYEAEEDMPVRISDNGNHIEVIYEGRISEKNFANCQRICKSTCTGSKKRFL